MSEWPQGFDPADWKAPAHAAWAFRHVDAFLPTKTIHAPREAIALPLAKSDWTPPTLMISGKVRSWSDYLQAVSATSALVIAGGRLVSETYAPPMAADHRHTLFSVTKTVVGLAALLLINRGTLSGSATASEIVPELAGTAFGPARLINLLAMQDGVPFDENYADSAAAIHWYSRHYWGSAPCGVLAALQSLPIAVPQQGRFSYRTPAADVIGLMLCAATGLGLAELISTLLWQPIGAEADALLICDTAGREIAGTGFTARPRDLARLALALLDRQHSPLPASVCAQLFAGGDSAAVEEAGYNTRPGWSYANLSWSPASGQIAAMGVHGQKMFLDRATGTALILTAAVPTPDVRHLDHWHEAAFRAVKRFKRTGRGAPQGRSG